MFEKGEPDKKINEIGFAKVATLEEVAKNGYVLTPGRYVGIKIDEEDEPFEEKMKEYSKEMKELLKEEAELTVRVKEVFKSLGWKI
jgi:type I restriction enzyme M protein